MRLKEYVVENRAKIITDTCITAIGFTIALIASSFIENVKEGRAQTNLLKAIKAEAQTNKILIRDFVKPNVDGGLVFSTLNTSLVSQALSSPTFLRHDSVEKYEALTGYRRCLDQSNVIGIKQSEVVAPSFNGEKRAPYADHLASLWNELLERCLVSIKSLEEKL